MCFVSNRWIRKYPTRTNGVGLYHNRFFVLYDNFLSYYQQPPAEFRNSNSTSANHTPVWTPNVVSNADRSLLFYTSSRPKGIPITEESTVEVIRSMFGRVVKVSTPNHIDNSSHGIGQSNFRNSFRSTSSTLTTNTTTDKKKDTLFLSFANNLEIESLWINALQRTIQLQVQSKCNSAHCKFL
jgi:hypothetical protein